MLELIAGNYRVSIIADSTHSVGSADNIHAYDHEYGLEDELGESAVTSRHAVRVSDNNEVVATCILFAGGGASGVHEHSAIIHDESCIIAVGPFMASLEVPSLKLRWTCQTDAATCFGVYRSEKHECLISHGELEIACVSYDGQLVWSSSGGDIFTNGFTLRDDSVRVVDFNGRHYTFDIETGREIGM